MLAVALSWLGCTCAPTGARDKRYVCTTDHDCADGFFCASTAECVKVGGAAGGGAGGGSAVGGGSGGGSGGGGAELDAGSDGGADAGTDAGTFGLYFTSAPQQVLVGSCSAPVTFEVRNGGMLQGVSGVTVITLSDTSNGALGVYPAPGCNDGGGALVLAPDASTGSFSYFANDGGSFTLGISAAGFAGDTQAAAGAFPPVKDVVFLGSQQTVRAGDCSAPVVLELRDAVDAPARANQPVVLSLSSSPTPGVTFYSDAICLTPVTQVTVPAGSSRATVYVARDTGRIYTLAADAGPGAVATLGHQVLPMVRSGNCLIGDGGSSVDCTVAPPVLSLSDSFVVFQVGAETDSIGSASVRCALSTPGNVHCFRLANDSYAQIYWQVAEIKGATVQKVELGCDAGTPSVGLATTAPPATSFLLSSQVSDGYIVNDNDFNITRLNSGGTGVDFDFGPCGSAVVSVGAQVVTLPAINVDRTNTSIPVNTAQRTVSMPPPPAAAIALAQWRVPGIIGVCPFGVRPEISTKDVVLSRGYDAGGFCESVALSDIFVERVDFKNTAAIQQLTLAMSPDAGSLTAAILPVDRTRTLVLTGGQGVMGQALGEGTHPGSVDGVDYLGEVAAQLSLVVTAGAYQSSQLKAQRQSVNGGARWTVYVVELKP